MTTPLRMPLIRRAIRPALAILVIALADAASGRSVIDLNRGWRFHRGDATPEAARWGDGWENVVLPHTYELASINLNNSDDDASQPTFHRGVCWYRRDVRLQATRDSRVYLEFEGAHQVTDLWVNGQHVGQHAVGGFTPFHFDITDFVNLDGVNTIALKLDNRPNEAIPPDGFTRDYVLFGGLYRDVRLVIAGPIHVTFPWEAREAGVRITTPSVSRRAATITCETAVRNTSQQSRSCRVVTRIADADGIEVERLSAEVTVPAGADRTVVQTGGVYEGVRLWSFEDPYLYRVHTTIERDGKVVDHVVNPLGLRWFELRTDQGFLLNGDPVELIGVNRHQQYPYIGDAVPDNLHRNDAIKFKRAGINVVRLAHYPHDNALLDACDELGILVVEEPPTWIEFGPPLWMDRLEQAQRVMIRNHRNHPCVWGWAGGINHRGPVRRLHEIAKEEDPTRITQSNSTLWTGPAHRGAADLYSVMDYRGAQVPEGELLFAMEHYGSIDVLGQQKIVSQYRGEVARIGLAAWAAHDGPSFKKRGERYPNLSRWKASLWNAFRVPLPAYHWYRAELTLDPMVHIPDERAQRPGEVVVFSNCDRVALRHPGGLIEPQPPTRLPENEHLRAPPFVFPVDWSDGELTAIGYRNNAEVARHTVRKPGAPDHLSLSFDTDGFERVADGSSVVLAYASLRDRDDTVLPIDDTSVSFSITGPGEIVGDASIGANPVLTERGVAPVLIRVGQDPGAITLTARTSGFTSANATLELDAHPGDVLRLEMPRKRRVLRADLGNPEQHVQEDWRAWPHQAGDATLDVDGVRLALTGDSDVTWTHSWGVPGDLCFLIEDGARSENGLTLDFAGVPPGEYTLRTWHHRVVDRQADAPALEIAVTDAAGEQRVAHDAFLPTFGRKISVSAAGNGGAGDGGSNLAAGRPAVCRLRVDDRGEAVIHFRSVNDGGMVTLNGLELVAD